MLCMQFSEVVSFIIVFMYHKSTLMQQRLQVNLCGLFQMVFVAVMFDKRDTM